MDVSDKSPEKSTPDGDFLDAESYYAEPDDSEGLLSKTRKSWKSNPSKPYIAVAFCLVIIAIQTVLLAQAYEQLRQYTTSPNGLSLRRTERRTVYEPSKYTSHNETEADDAWGSILAGHGVVAISPDYVTQHHMPDSVELPDKTGNRMYVIEAYHAIHCTATLRTHYMALDRGIPGNWSRPHDTHCFDALRQYIMCNIDDTLLYTTGHRESGTGQSKQCHDWDALRDWAEERSASYFDVEPGLGISHLRNYHAGDGLPVGALS